MWSRVRGHMPIRRGRAARPAADQHARPAAAVTEAAPADDAPAPSRRGGTLVLPVLGDTDDATALPSTKEQDQDSYAPPPPRSAGGTLAQLEDRLPASAIDYTANSARPARWTAPAGTSPTRSGTGRSTGTSGNGWPPGSSPWCS